MKQNKSRKSPKTPKRKPKETSFDVFSDSETDHEMDLHRMDNIEPIDNEYLSNSVDKKDDEEIDEDDAFNDDDEEAYGSYFKVSQINIAFR